MLKTRSKTRAVGRGRFLVLATALLLLAAWVFMPTQANSHETAVDLPLGAVVRIFAVCDAAGANEVAKANLLAGSREGGNKTFMEQRNAEPQHCWLSNIPVQLRVVEITYTGKADNGLHVYIVKFEGDDLYGVLTGRHSPEPEPAGFGV